MGGRLQLPFLAPSQSAKKLWQSQSLNRRKPRKTLRLPAYGPAMKTALVSRSTAVVLLLLTVSVWVVLILVALHVSGIVLDTLDMIVQLAAISPDPAP